MPNNANVYYKLFSVNLLRFIKAHGIRPVSKGVHPVTLKNYWLFIMTDELSEILHTWSHNRRFINKNYREVEWKVGQ